MKSAVVLAVGCCRAVLAAVLVLSSASVSSAQDAAAGPEALSDDLEPRIVGTTGTTMIGVSGFVDRWASSRTAFSTNYILQVDAARFLTRRIAAIGGLAGTGTVGTDTADTAEATATGRGAPALHVSGGAVVFFTPQSIASLYAGASYWNQLTRRDGDDASAVVGTVGLQGAMSSRASFYVEGGYGVSLTRGDHGELVSRILGRVGFRFKL